VALRRSQVIGLTIALGAGLAAFVAYRAAGRRPVQPVAEAPSITQVLVMREDVPIGQPINESRVRWQDWPRSAATSGLITQERRPNAIKELSGALAKASLFAGEPLVEQRLVKSGKGGVLAAMLEKGYRAVATKITEQSSAGKMILPGDYVDVLVTQRRRSEVQAETLINNVKVLAIGQNIENKDGKKTADGNVATLELTPTQAQALARGTMIGEISLMLRSIEDAGTADASVPKGRDRPGGVRIIRYGQSQLGTAVN
jgi:pilus assembly protein CpaB